MTVISITISQSPVEKISGIPINITLTANVPCTIFYTLDGSTPDFNSSVAIGPINLPSDKNSILFKYFGSDGIDTSAILTEYFGVHAESTNSRVPFAQVTNANPGVPVRDLYPFGGVFPNPPPLFGNAGSVYMDSPLGLQIPDGYDGTGTSTPAAFTNLPVFDYNLVFSETDSEGRRGKGIGNLPAKVYIPPTKSPPDSSNVDSAMFNPKALVMYQDSTVEPDDPNHPVILREHFSLANSETHRDGALLFTTGFEGNTTTGSLLRQHFNPRDNTITYYYYDSATNRWIINKTAATATKGQNNLYEMILPANRDQGAGFVYRWIPFMRRALI